ncbi:hypothetical protein, partial [Streptomyces sp. WAC 06725]|uniref:hypothetical protein n=1 Tax=Streptomyces sp. WAC 06725 TaxID=2203209 RepID=UPI001C8C71CD
MDSPTAKDTPSQQGPGLSVRALLMNVAARCCPASTEDPLKQWKEVRAEEATATALSEADRRLSPAPRSAPMSQPDPPLPR